jgi:uncharacterized protein YlxW (UPF0749 family)
MSKFANPRLKLTVSLTIISAILGLMLSMQYKNTRAAVQLNSQVPTVDPRAQYTAAQLAKIKETNKQLEEQIEKLNKQLYAYEKQAGDMGKDIAPQLRDELTKYKIMAGLLPVKGVGLTFTVNDSTKDIPKGSSAAPYITHDSDLRMIVNELFLAGAEAVSINDQRISTTTGIICIGPTVMINGQRVVPPYEFKAIGNPQNMIVSLELKGGVIDTLTNPEHKRYLTFSPRKTSPNITIPAYAGDFNGLKK